MSEPPGFSAEQRQGNHAYNLSWEAGSQAKVLFSVLGSGCCKGRKAAAPGHQTEWTLKISKANWLSLHRLVSMLEWGELVTYLPAIKPLVKSHPLGCFHEYLEMLYKVNSLIAVPSYAVRTWAYSSVSHLLPTQAALGKGTCHLPKWQSPPSRQSHPAMEEGAFPISKQVYFLLTSSQGI